MDVYFEIDSQTLIYKRHYIIIATITNSDTTLCIYTLYDWFAETMILIEHEWGGGQKKVDLK